MKKDAHPALQKILNPKRCQPASLIWSMQSTRGKTIRLNPSRNASCLNEKREVTGETMKIEWVDGFEIRVSIDHGAAVISANREGLLSLAKQFAALAEAVPGSHIHYDEYNSLEEGSAEMLIARAK